MSLPPVIDVHLDLGVARADGYGFYHRPEEYGTQAFDRDFMRRTIGMGEPIFRDGVEFVGFNQRANPTKLNLDVWFGFVPEAYRDDVEGVRGPLWERFGNMPINLDPRAIAAPGHVTIDIIVEFIQEWICTHIVPTDEPLPRWQRFANAWYDIGLMAAYKQGRITRVQAHALQRR
jgi:hypothetical protein